MAIKAVAVDESGIHHLIIGLNRDNVDSLLNGDVVTLPPGYISGLDENSDVVLLFAETDAELATRFPPALRPIQENDESKGRVRHIGLTWMIQANCWKVVLSLRT